MNHVMTAFRVELRKNIAATVMRATSVLLVVAITVLAGALTMAAHGGNEQVIAQLGTQSDSRGWPLLTGVAAQITAAGGLLGFAVALSWMFGREFSDGAITGLFALPISRPTMALAKFAAYLVWVAAVALGLTLMIGAVGLISQGSGDTSVVESLARQWGLTFFSGLLATPAAWAATLGRGLLPGIATGIGLVVVAQIMVVAGTGAWFPVAAPALWAFDPGSVSGMQLAFVLVVPVASVGLTMHAWRVLELNR